MRAYLIVIILSFTLTGCFKTKCPPSEWYELPENSKDAKMAYQLGKIAGWCVARGITKP